VESKAMPVEARDTCPPYLIKNPTHIFINMIVG
jgi:hypothetical protein